MSLSKKHLKHLISFFNEVGLQTEATELQGLLRKYATDNDKKINEWLALSNEIDKPEEQGAVTKALIKGYVYTYNAYQELEALKPMLKNIDKDLFLKSLQMFLTAKTANLKNPRIIKESMDKEADWSFWKSLPYISIIIQVYVIISNIYYGLNEYYNILEKNNTLGLTFVDAMNPNKISELIALNMQNPLKLIEIVQIIKSTIIFKREVLSLFVTSLDTIKDLLFLIPNTLTVGVSAWWDFGLSVLIYSSQYGIESQSAKPYEDALEQLRNLSEFNIQLLNEKQRKLEFEDPEKQDGIEWWNSTYS
jgi:hypothetical protein